jgi:hypothetical protein
LAEPGQSHLEACPCPGELQEAYRPGCRALFARHVCLPSATTNISITRRQLQKQPHCLGILVFLTAGRPARRGRLDTGSKASRSRPRRSLGSGHATLDPPFWAICRPLYPIRRFIRAECHTILQTNLTGPLDRSCGAKVFCEDTVLQAGRHIYEAPTCAMYPGSAAISPTRQVNSLYILLPRTV